MEKTLSQSMKKTFLVLLLLSLTAAVKAQAIFQNINLAENFFAQLDSGNYSKAYAFFDTSVQEKIKVENLKTLWTQMEAKIGKFKAVDGVQNKIKDDYQIVTLNLQFATDNQPFQLSFNKENKIAGIFLVPKQLENAYKLPNYADTTAYTQKLVTIKSGEFDLPAMLTLPKDSLNCPVVVLVHGSGPSDMNESIGPNRPFEDIAVGLASKGIASLRYVKRTLIFPSAFKGAFTVKEEVLDDASAAINFLKTVPQVNQQKIYVLGHSLGGMLAPRIAVLNPTIKGLILAAAPARKLQDLAIEQNNYFNNLQTDSLKKANAAALAANIKLLNDTKLFDAKTPQQDSVVLGLPVSYWADLNSMDQLALAKKLSQRIFLIQGGQDFQVSTQDFALWQKALKGKSNADTKLYPMLNHLFVFVSSKGDNNQYAKPGNIDQTVIEDLASWINQK
ncbi:MAG TPA: alpha/beta fold hydrolase [Pelobium sp.]